jgi:hypothetical protein
LRAGIILVCSSAIFFFFFFIVIRNYSAFQSIIKHILYLMKVIPETFLKFDIQVFTIHKRSYIKFILRRRWEIQMLVD